ncbi:MAG: hypothetical protein IJW92_09090 [Clostridia bacterium]|nr:hypothetical protein [Clostridia bacterium]
MISFNISTYIPIITYISNLVKKNRDTKKDSITLRKTKYRRFDGEFVRNFAVFPIFGRTFSVRGCGFKDAVLSELLIKLPKAPSKLLTRFIKWTEWDVFASFFCLDIKFVTEQTDGKISCREHSGHVGRPMCPECLRELFYRLYARKGVLRENKRTRQEFPYLVYILFAVKVLKGCGKTFSKVFPRKIASCLNHVLGTLG